MLLTGCPNKHVRAARQGTPSKKVDPPRGEPLLATPPKTSVPTLEPDYLKALEASPTQSTSLGSPNYGSLTGALEIPESGPGLRHNPIRPNAASGFGTIELVQALMHASARVHEQLPNSTLYVNDIGFEVGGKIPHHGSHQNGRDVDVLFYLLDEMGDPVRPVGVPIDPKGLGWDFKDLAIVEDDVPLHLDVVRTWKFLQALVEDPRHHVQRIFVAEHVRKLLLDHAEQIDAPQSARERVGDLTCQPELPHDDHLHIRFFCSAEDIRAGCLDTPPIYPWQLAVLEKQEVTPVLARSRKKKSSKKARPSAEEIERLSKMHINVQRFLKQREGWLERPHPHRRYCR